MSRDYRDETLKVLVAMCALAALLGVAIWYGSTLAPSQRGTAWASEAATVTDGAKLSIVQWSPERPMELLRQDSTGRVTLRRAMPLETEICLERAGAPDLCHALGEWLERGR